MHEELLILLSYGLLGAGIKYADQAYDLGVFNKKFANILAIPGGLLFAGLVIFDPPSTTIFLALFIALAITKKIDNNAFYLGTGALLILPLALHDTMKLEWLPFGILILSGILDEVGNDWADKRINKKLVNNLRNHNSSIHNLAEKFFHKRFAMKISVLSLVLLAFFPPIYFFAFLLFDFMYLLVEYYSFRIKVYHISQPLVSQPMV